jgi:chemotaxis protein MotB
MDDSTPIVIKRVVRSSGHHGGAWKVAYADFVTAMMALFLLMWLMGAATKEEKAAISEYFNNPSAEMGTSPTPKPGGMEGPGGASTSPIDLGGSGNEPTVIAPTLAAQTQSATEQVQEKQQQEKAAMQAVADKLEQAMRNNAALAPFRDHLLIDMTPEGLRIMIVDRANRPMFDVGSAELLPGSRNILQEIAELANQLPNRLSITGHTDARPFINPKYGNWELSADRANAARRELIADGLDPSKIAKVVGLASSQPFESKDPMAPINRRIAIIVLKQDVDKAQQDLQGQVPSRPPVISE